MASAAVATTDPVGGHAYGQARGQGNARGQAIAPDLVERARAYADLATSDATRRAYRADLASWATWALARGMDPDGINPVAVAGYLTDMAGALSVATLARRMAGLNAYLRAGGRDPVSTRAEPLKSVWRGIQRAHGAPQNKKAPLVVTTLRRVVGELGDGTADVRDAALMVVGFAGAMRRADLVGLDWEAGQGGAGFVNFTRDGLLITFTRSKTDQTGEGEAIGLAYGSTASTCPVRTLQAWRDRSARELGMAAGPVFRGVSRHGAVGKVRMDGGSVARIVKRRLAAALEAQGESPANVAAAVRTFSGHSMRAGFITSAFLEGVPEAAIMPHTRHRKAETLYGYRRTATVFQDNPSARVGL